MNSTPASHFDRRNTFGPDNQPAPHRRKRSGSRAKLAQRFFEDTYAAWEEQGESALARAAFHDPMGFVSMVARLMPQKIEVSTPTDGMSDERLAEMLELAERMAHLRSQGVATPLLAHELADENAVTLDQAEEGGGGPLGLGGARGVSSTDPVTADPLRGRIAETPHNKLGPSELQGTPERQIAETPHSKLGVPDSGSATTERHIAETPQSLVQPALPYPVGRPFPKADHVVEHENRNGLARSADDDIDPASLF